MLWFAISPRDRLQNFGVCVRTILAAIAQLVEHLIRNEGVRCSNHRCGTNRINGLIALSPICWWPLKARVATVSPREPTIHAKACAVPGAMSLLLKRLTRYLSRLGAPASSGSQRKPLAWRERVRRDQSAIGAPSYADPDARRVPRGFGESPGRPRRDRRALSGGPTSAHRPKKSLRPQRLAGALYPMYLIFAVA